MSEVAKLVDVTKPMQFKACGKKWHDITWSKLMADGQLVFCYGDDDKWLYMASIKETEYFRNKPAHNIRPYTMDEAVKFIGKAVRRDGNYYLIVAVAPNASRRPYIHIQDVGKFHPQSALEKFTHADGTPFGVKIDTD